MTSRTAAFGTLTMLALTFYFTIAAMVVNSDTASRAEYALVKGLGIVAGACALTMLAFIAMSLRLQVEDDARLARGDRADGG